MPQFYKSNLMSDKSNAVGVILTVFNGERHLKSTINSLLSQSHSNWILYIVENASIDNTRKVLQLYNEDTRLNIEFLSENISRTCALNYGFKLISPEVEYVMILDDDDILEPKWMEHAVDFLNKEEDIGVLGGWAHVMDENGNKYDAINAPAYPELINEMFSYTFPVVHSSLFFRKNIVDLIPGPYDINVSIGQDWDLCIKLSMITKICVLDKYSISWRRYDKSITGDPGNFLISRMDKLNSLTNGVKCAKSFQSYFKNRNRRGVENLAIALLNFRDGNYLKSIYRVLLSIYQSPFSIIFNNKIIKPRQF
jgi:glycosyltransferase involved in cell wall biosynthesis